MTIQQNQQVELMTTMLEHFRWRRSGGIDGSFEVWLSSDGKNEIVLPLDPTRADFNRLLAIAESQIGQKLGNEGHRYRELLEVSEASALDEAHWHKETTVAAGLIPWGQGELLYASARSMLLASAKSTREPKMYHGNASSFLAKRFLDECLMGQTGVGSFIITAHTPAKKRFHFSKRSEEIADVAPPSQLETTSGRDIMDTFQNALELARTCLDEYRTRQSLEVFVEAVPLGLSYEFVKALSETALAGDAGIQLIRDEPSVKRVQKVFSFDAVEAPVLEKVAVRFAQAYEPAEVTLVGEVVLLSHVPHSENHVVRLVAESGSYVNTARIRMDAEQYALALEAHRTNRRIQVSGRIEREGNFHWIYAPRDIHIVGEPRWDVDEDPLFT